MNLFKYFYSLRTAGKRLESSFIKALESDEKQEINGYRNNYRRYKCDSFIGNLHEDQSVNAVGTQAHDK